MTRWSVLVAALTSPPSAEDCGSCHVEQLEAWRDSGHRTSWTGPLFQAGYIAEPHAFCVECHAPLPGQLAEVDANRAYYLGQHPTRYRDVERAPEPWAAEGITCATCHWRDGEVLAPSKSWAAPHAVREAPELAESSFCAGCHDFAAPALLDGAVVGEVPMQSTFAEWEAWGGVTTCQGCHMPQGAHTWPGAYDVEALRAAVRVRRVPGGLEITAVGVGHAFPTGDLFRHVTVEVDDRVVARFGRRYELEWDGERVRKQLVEDTALRPDAPVVVEVDGPWRVVYHYGGEHDEARGWLPLDALTVVLHHGE